MIVLGIILLLFGFIFSIWFTVYKPLRFGHESFLTSGTLLWVGSMVGGIVLIFSSSTFAGILTLVIFISLVVILRSAGSPKKIDSSKTSFRICKICSKETSKMGNYTNMFLSGISMVEQFNNQYGIMCADHAAEITEKIMEEKNLTETDLKNAQ